MIRIGRMTNIDINLQDVIKIKSFIAGCIDKPKSSDLLDSRLQWIQGQQEGGGLQGAQLADDLAGDARDDDAGHFLVNEIQE